MPRNESDRSTAAGIGALAAGTSPFWGMIGQKPIKIDPHLRSGIKDISINHLGELARPGDVVLASRGGWEGYKATQAPFSGSEFFHAAPVVGKNKGIGTVTDAGHLYTPGDKSKPNLKEMLRRAEKAPFHFSQKGYDDLVLLRPEKELTPQQLKRLQQAYVNRAFAPYSVTEGVKATLTDLFKPKILGASKGTVPVCVGSMCSGLPAQAFNEAGILESIAAGKNPRHVLPADFLREGSGFKAIGAVLEQDRSLKNKLIRNLHRYGSRGLLGAGIAGTVYGGYKDPAATAGVLGGLATPLLLRQAATEIYKRKPGISPGQARRAVTKEAPSLIKVLFSRFDPGHKQRVLRYLSRTAPAGIAGGIGSYLLADKIREWVKNKQAE